VRAHPHPVPASTLVSLGADVQQALIQAHFPERAGVDVRAACPGKLAEKPAALFEVDNQGAALTDWEIEADSKLERGSLGDGQLGMLTGCSGISTQSGLKDGQSNR